MLRSLLSVKSKRLEARGRDHQAPGEVHEALALRDAAF